MRSTSIIRLFLVAGALAAWEAVRRLDLVHAILLASPSEIARAAFDAGDPLVTAFRTTFVEIVIAIAVSWTLGVGAGLAIGMNRRLGDFFAPILSSAFAVPKIMFYPLLLVWLGIGPVSKIAFAVFTSFFTIALTTMDAVRAVDTRVVPVVRSFGASRATIVARVLVPLALPGIVSGLRIGTALIVIGVIVAEMLASFNGIGFWISSNRSSFNTPEVYLGIVLALACSITISSILSRIERRFGAWREAERAREGVDARTGGGTF